MIEAVLRGARHMGAQLAALSPRQSGGGCGIHFDAHSLHFVRLMRVPGGDGLRLDASGATVLDDGILQGARIAKPEAAARSLSGLLERIGISAADLGGDTVVAALPAHGLRTQIVDCPADLPPRALRAWCERRAALLLPGDGDLALRNRVGVTWAEPGGHRLRLYACEADLVDDRAAVLEMAGLPVHAVDAAHEAGRRAFRWVQSDSVGAVAPVALLQIDASDLDLAVFEGRLCIADARERFDGVGGHPEALASVVRELVGGFPAAPDAIYVAANGASPAGLVAISDALAAACAVPVRHFDPLQRFEAPASTTARRHGFVPQASLAVPCGLALRAMEMRGMSCG
ncbi:pilus assembly protein PilM [Pandoraea pnomenusa]|uniref:type IV pilus biogenesis protein PilM n=1 Tax=Pandoraea pnomenusa TaxID=93220 RepID=UPI0033401E27